MKKLMIINGTMGVGKSTVCKEINKKLNNSVWLDGDWCWMMNPWVFSDENKQMAVDNICYLLGSFLRNSTFEYVIFSWVINKEEIFDIVLNGLRQFEFRLHKISLICSEAALKERMLRDGRSLESIEISLKHLELYQKLDTQKIDTTNVGIQETVDTIVQIVGEQIIRRKN